MTAAGPDPVVSYLESTLGLSFTGPRRARLLAAVEAQRAAAGLSPEAFLASVSRPGAAHDRLIADVTVGETYFFRDRSQCDLLRDVVLPSFADGSDRRLALWSAGCASGEEAFTLAALADEAGLGERCLVVGSDASRRAVDRAQAAEYGAWSMRSTTAAEKGAHFRQQDGRWHVAERLQQRTRFVQRNLLDGPPPPGRFDVVLCRNLLIYLTREAVHQVAEILAGALTTDGWLITAAGDPPLAAAGLESVRTPYGLAYRRAGADVLPEVRTERAAPAAPPSSRSGRRSRPAPAPVRARPPRPSQAGRRPEPAAATAADLATQVRALGDAGRVDEACRVAAEAVAAHPMDVELRYLEAVVLLEAGRLEPAAAAASSAAYLDPQLPAVHLLLGQVEHARGNVERARRSFRNGSRLLAAGGEAPVALAGGAPAAHLAAVADHYLSTSTSSAP
jgi:chemotaxis protein methyltransferase CheR